MRCAADIRLDGEPAHYRATLCRCGASKNKPYCDGSHHEAGFAATGEPPTGKADMLAVRDGPLAIDPQTDGPLQVRGNMEITSGTGRVVARVTSARSVVAAAAPTSRSATARMRASASAPNRSCTSAQSLRQKREGGRSGP